MPHVHDCFIRKLSAFHPLIGQDIARLRTMVSSTRAIPAHQELIHQARPGGRAFVLHKGWACSYKLLRDGERQVVDFHVPGDFLGLRDLLLPVCDRSIVTVTEAIVSEVSLQGLARTFQQAPRLALAVLRTACIEEAAVAEHLVDVGRRSARARTAHMLIELYLRLRLVGLASPAGYACPLSQGLLADALGLTSIHLNRVLRRLREPGLATFRNGFVSFQDLHGLKEVAAFDGSYLEQIGTGPLLAA